MASTRPTPAWMATELVQMIVARAYHAHAPMTEWRFQTEPPAHHLALDFRDPDVLLPRWKLRAFARRVVKTGVQRGFYQLPVNLPGVEAARMEDPSLAIAARVIGQYDIQRDEFRWRIDAAWS